MTNLSQLDNPLQSIRELVLRRITLDRWGRMIDAAADRADEGDIADLKLLLEYGYGKPSAAQPRHADQDPHKHHKRIKGIHIDESLPPEPDAASAADDPSGTPVSLPSDVASNAQKEPAAAEQPSSAEQTPGAQEQPTRPTESVPPRASHVPDEPPAAGEHAAPPFHLRPARP